MLRKIRKLVQLLCKAIALLKNGSLCIKYRIRYGNAAAGIMGSGKCLICLGGWFYGLILSAKCVVKPSKVIISYSDDGKGRLYVFDRPASKDYWEMRDLWNQFHNSPRYIKIDDSCFYQEHIADSDTLLSVSHDSLCKLLSNYLTSQVDLGHMYGTEAPASSFLGPPYELLAAKNCFDVFPSSFFARADELISSNKLMIAVPSVIEPWPAVSKKGLLFGDLSPVEFRSAPLLHDLCYMLMKYEMYGSRSEGHSPFMPLLCHRVAHYRSERMSAMEKCDGKSLVKFFEQIKRIVNIDEFMDSYISMVLFHCYVKYHATGRFVGASPDRRLSKAVNRHAVIFSAIEQYAS